MSACCVDAVQHPCVGDERCRDMHSETIDLTLCDWWCDWVHVLLYTRPPRWPRATILARSSRRWPAVGLPTHFSWELCFNCLLVAQGGRNDAGATARVLQGRRACVRWMPALDNVRCPTGPVIYILTLTARVTAVELRVKVLLVAVHACLLDSRSIRQWMRRLSRRRQSYPGHLLLTERLSTTSG